MTMMSAMACILVVLGFISYLIWEDEEPDE